MTLCLLRVLCGWFPRDQAAGVLTRVHLTGNPRPDNEQTGRLRLELRRL